MECYPCSRRTVTCHILRIIYIKNLILNQIHFNSVNIYFLKLKPSLFFFNLNGTAEISWFIIQTIINLLACQPKLSWNIHHFFSKQLKWMEFGGLESPTLARIYYC